MAVPEVSPPVALASRQVTTMRPSGKAASEGSSWMPDVVVLTMISPPTLPPAASKTCNRMAGPPSRPMPLLSSQAIAKPPFGRAVMAGACWLPAVVVLTLKMSVSGVGEAPPWKMRALTSLPPAPAAFDCTQETTYWSLFSQVIAGPKTLAPAGASMRNSAAI